MYSLTLQTSVVEWQEHLTHSRKVASSSPERTSHSFFRKRGLWFKPHVYNLTTKLVKQSTCFH